MSMQLTPGQVLIHPHHGPVRVMGTTVRRLQGKAVRYVGLLARGSDLEISVPVEKAEEIGVREPMGQPELTEVFDVLLAPSPKQEKQWSRRIKAQVEQFRSGDMREIARVVRDLLRRQKESGVSMGERQLLRDAESQLVGELEVCLGLDEDRATTVLHDAVLDGTAPELDEARLAPAV